MTPTTTDRALLVAALALGVVWIVPSGVPLALRTGAGFSVGASIFTLWMRARAGQRAIATKASEPAQATQPGPPRSSEAVLIRWAIMATLLLGLAIGMDHPFAFQIWPMLLVPKRGANPVATAPRRLRLAIAAMQAVCAIALVWPIVTVISEGRSGVPAPQGTAGTLSVGAFALLMAFAADPLARRLRPVVVKERRGGPALAIAPAPVRRRAGRGGSGNRRDATRARS
ncbi:hypothetical protein [Rhodanobacter sp. FW106-PBR-LB-2-11]|uniref:hypothetical protein n=1 Tax=Rhodanobacter sp. FW106-PBR-LB-2-11 TaxID=1524463 RepID=UPI0034E43CD1